MATDQELVERARTLRRGGLSIEQIATRLDLRSRSMVYRWVRDLPVHRGRAARMRRTTCESEPER
jgi:transposase